MMASPTALGAPDLLASFSGVKKAGDGWSAKCPAHQDHRASLSIGQGDAGGHAAILGHGSARTRPR